MWIGSSSAERMLCLGSREAYGSWKTICMFFLNGFSFLPLSREISVPSNTTCPFVGSVSRMMVLPRVVLPHPDSPTSPRVSPLFTPIETPSTALRCETVLLRNPPRLGNHLQRSVVL